MRKLTFEAVVDLYGHAFPDDARVETGIPDWFSSLQNNISIHFVDVERLTNPLSAHDFSRARRRPRSAKRAVNVYSSELAERIQQTLAEYGSLSQSLDRTFPHGSSSNPIS